MIATGGLLRINARRQDSLRSKPHKLHTHKRKNKKKRRSEVVVVKGKLKLCSVSGFVAALGVLVLLVGVVMAALGYWPRDGLFFSTRPQEGSAMAFVSSSSPTPVPANVQGGETAEEPEGDNIEDRGGGGGGDEGFNRTETINGTTRQNPRGFLEDFLDRYLYSDRLKVFGPLIMGIGIFLFICANAVLHENRDKKTKVINLRDIYSTVIDLHSLRKPNATSSCSARRSSANPLNGLVNYVQSKSLEAKPKVYPASLLNRREGGGGGGEGGGGLSRQPGSSRGGRGGGGSDAVFSIYQDQPDHPPPSSHRLSLPQSFSPPHISTCWASLQEEVLSSTLPLHHPRPLTSRRRHSVRAGRSRGWEGGAGGKEDRREEGGGDRKEERQEEGGGDRKEERQEEEGGDRKEERQEEGGSDRKEERQEEGGSDRKEEVDACTPPLCSSTLPTHSSSFSLHQDVPGGSQALLLLSSSSLTPSHLSLSSLSHLLSSSSSTLAPTCRRRSLPTSSVITGYSKLTHGEDESFEYTSSHLVTSQDRGQRSEEVTSQDKGQRSEKVTSQDRGQRSEEVMPHRKYSNREKLRMISQLDSRLRQEEEG